eukprot:11187776-Lingulodinium_polyedra.AAC.1
MDIFLRTAMGARDAVASHDAKDEMLEAFRLCEGPKISASRTRRAAYPKAGSFCGEDPPRAQGEDQPEAEPRRADR